MADTTQPTASAEAKGKVAKGVIAKGRTVVDGTKVKGAGDTVTLPEAEIVWLTKHGYLVDPDAEEITEASGPTFERR